MKTTSFGFLTIFSLILVIVLLPMHVYQDNRLRTQEKVLELVTYYDGALRTAVQDAGVALVANERQMMGDEIKYDSEKKIKLNKEEAIEAFYRTLYLNFGIVEDKLAQDLLRRYIPAAAIVEYDGLWVFSDEEYSKENGMVAMQQVWHGKKPFVYTDANGNSLSFTLDDFVYAYVADEKKWYEGKREDVHRWTDEVIPLLRDENLFDQVRRLTIVQVIQSELEHFINRHNEYVRRLGISYTFTLPTISQEEWNNTIDDTSFIAFLQGVPAGTNSYNNYAFGGGRLVRKHDIYGATQNGRKIYYRAGCNYPDAQIEEVFTSEKAAAAKGYHPKPCENN